MTDVHFGADCTLDRRGLCTADGHLDDAYWHCDAPVIAGGHECALCLIARVHRETAHEDVRVFGPVVIAETEVTG